MWNPLERYPGKLECWCGSPKQSRRCCKPRLLQCVTFHLGNQLEGYMREIEQGRRPKLSIQKPQDSQPRIEEKEIILTDRDQKQEVNQSRDADQPASEEPRDR